LSLSGIGSTGVISGRHRRGVAVHGCFFRKGDGNSPGLSSAGSAFEARVCVGGGSSDRES
jgi:hypothetical protein